MYQQQIVARIMKQYQILVISAIFTLLMTISTS